MLECLKMLLYGSPERQARKKFWGSIFFPNFVTCEKRVKIWWATWDVPERSRSMEFCWHDGVYIWVLQKTNTNYPEFKKNNNCQIFHRLKKNFLANLKTKKKVVFLSSLASLGFRTVHYKVNDECLLWSEEWLRQGWLILRPLYHSKHTLKHTH